MELTRSARPWLCRIFAVLVVVFSAASVVRAEDIYDEEKVIESDSFLRLRKNLRSVMNSVDPEVVDAETNRELQSAFDRMFESFESQTLETLQPAELSMNEKKRRLPFGLLHRRAHEIIDNADLPPGSKALGTLHRSIHHVFSSSFSPDACYPKFAANHTGCLERAIMFFSDLLKFPHQKHYPKPSFGLGSFLLTTSKLHETSALFAVFLSNLVPKVRKEGLRRLPKAGSSPPLLPLNSAVPGVGGGGLCHTFLNEGLTPSSSSSFLLKDENYI
ncbi:unnamed protein product [Notodromas monacha]|uniref:Uncharacterized protein n=1 Tax=Notodromas monacha TaxID=399045 RepID=A0A7R9GDV0_9CRUS|nr:unnamed protein product [Notodromas monacha]CAG0917342.1 unnamed protein product [Notodromas monacha]